MHSCVVQKSTGRRSFESRRGNSNPGPVHYDERAAGDVCGSDHDERRGSRTLWPILTTAGHARALRERLGALTGDSEGTLSG
jgi:hypothetical protein